MTTRKRIERLEKVHRAEHPPPPEPWSAGWIAALSDDELDAEIARLDSEIQAIEGQPPQDPRP